MILFIETNLNGRDISRKHDVNWKPISCDLTPLNEVSFNKQNQNISEIIKLFM